MDGHSWYAKYIADLATSTINDQESTSSLGTRLTLYSSPASGQVVIVDPSFAPIFLVIVTLCVSISIPLLLARLPKSFSVLWCFVASRRRGDPEKVYDRSSRIPRSRWHMPILLANSGQWLGDMWGAVTMGFRCLRRGEWMIGFGFLTFAIFCIVAIVLGPAVALIVSRDVAYGFAGQHESTCLPQFNFSVGAPRYVTHGLEHHGRAHEVLAWTSSFNYLWAENNPAYRTSEPVVDPTSQVKYERLNGCLLNDEVLCDSRFPRTHKVSVDMSPSRLGLWYEDTWLLRLTGYCLRLNSTSISRRTTTVTAGYQYGLQLATGARRTKSAAECPTVPESVEPEFLGQRDYQRFDRRKNVITDSFFVNSDADRQFPCHRWRDSLRALDFDGVTVLTVLPSEEDINQQPDDELYLPPRASSNGTLPPASLAHIMCWEDLHVVNTQTGQAGKTSPSWANRTALLSELGLPAAVNPLLHFANTEFLLKPVRYLRGTNGLLQSVAESPRWEYDATNAPSVPFGAEMHRWAHVGAMDIASKATRAATGFYARGNASALAAAAGSGGVAREVEDLCRSVRVAQEGALSIPLRSLVALAAVLGVALVWWLLERLVVALAEWGFAGPFGSLRAFLLLPASTPVSLAVSAEVALLRANGWNGHLGETVHGSATGFPEIVTPSHLVVGPSLEQRLDQGGGWVLGWGLWGFTHAGRDRLNIL